MARLRGGQYFTKSPCAADYLTLGATFLFLATACGDTGSGSPGGNLPTFEGTIDLEFGEIDGDDPYLFTHIGSVMEDPSGRIIVADIQSHEVRVFDSGGGFLFSFGGEGEGPGDLVNPCCLAFGPDGLLWVRADVRYSAFSLGATTAEYEREVRLGHTGIGMLAPITFDTAGRLVDVGTLTSTEGSPLFVRLHRDPTGAVDTVTMADPERQTTGLGRVSRMLGDSPVTFFLFQVYGPTWMQAHGPGGVWAEGISAEYSINFHHADGTASRIEGPPLMGPALAPNERQWAEDRIDSDIERFGLDEHPFGVPERKPPLAGLFFDRSGRLWVERTRIPGAEMSEADVYEEASLVARHLWPRRVRASGLSWITDSTLYGVTTDSLGVQRVARVRFRRAG